MHPYFFAEFPDVAAELVNGFLRRSSSHTRLQGARLLLRRQYLSRLSGDELGKFPVTLGLLVNRLERSPHAFFLLADEEHVGPSAKRLDRGILNRGCCQHSTHVEIVGDDEPTIADLFAQDLAHPFLRQRRRSEVIRNLGISRVRHHHEWQISSQLTIRKQVFIPEALPRLVNQWQVVVRVEIRFPQPREVLAAAKNLAVAKPAQELASVLDGLIWIGRNRSRGQHTFRWLKLKVERRREIGVEPQGTHFFADDAAMFAEELLRAGGCDLGNGWRRRDHIAQPIDRSAFPVHAQK